MYVEMKLHDLRDAATVDKALAAARRSGRAEGLKEAAKLVREMARHPLALENVAMGVGTENVLMVRLSESLLARAEEVEHG